jgi:hypothetical protein
LAGSVSAILLIGVLSVYSHHVNRRAEEIFHKSYELSTRSHVPTLGDLRQLFGADLKQPDPCTPWGCKYEATLSNHFGNGSFIATHLT